MMDDTVLPPVCEKCKTRSLLYIAPNGDAWEIQWIKPSDGDVGLVHNTRVKHTKPDHLYCKKCDEYFNFAHFLAGE